MPRTLSFPESQSSLYPKSMSGRLIILPKKRWNVWNREAIAKVRNDEKQLAEETRAAEAAQREVDAEARVELLRRRAQAAADLGGEGSSGASAAAAATATGREGLVAQLPAAPVTASLALAVTGGGGGGGGFDPSRPHEGHVNLFADCGPDGVALAQLLGGSGSSGCGSAAALPRGSAKNEKNAEAEAERKAKERAEDKLSGYAALALGGTAEERAANEPWWDRFAATGLASTLRPAAPPSVHLPAALVAQTFPAPALLPPTSSSSSSSSSSLSVGKPMLLLGSASVAPVEEAATARKAKKPKKDKELKDKKHAKKKKKKEKKKKSKKRGSSSSDSSSSDSDSNGGGDDGRDRHARKRRWREASSSSSSSSSSGAAASGAAASVAELRVKRLAREAGEAAREAGLLAAHRPRDEEAAFVAGHLASRAAGRRYHGQFFPTPVLSPPGQAQAPGGGYHRQQ